MSPPKITNVMIYEKLDTLSVIISGKEDDRHDQGLVGDVEKNTSFRSSVQKMIWVVFVGIIGGNIPILYFGGRLIVQSLTGESP